jgi:hypothetical protein
MTTDADKNGKVTEGRVVKRRATVNNFQSWHAANKFLHKTLAVSAKFLL